MKKKKTIKLILAFKIGDTIEGLETMYNLLL